MPTADGIMLAFATLKSAGFYLPRTMSTPEAESYAIEVWCELLSDMSDDDVMGSVRAFARESTERWWPTPGKLRELIPTRHPRRWTHLRRYRSYHQSYCRFRSRQGWLENGRHRSPCRLSCSHSVRHKPLLNFQNPRIHLCQRHGRK